MASRHLSRALVLQTLFECDLTSALNTAATKVVLKRNSAEFDLGASDLAFAEALLAGVLAKQTEIDAVIMKAAPQWPLDKIAPIDRNVLRIGLYELLFGDRTAVPPKVALNEAIEIGKSFGGEQSGKFVNGVLGAVYRDIGEPQKGDLPKVEVPTEAEPLAGAVVVSGTGESLKVALVLDAFHRWTLPKTHMTEGELTQAAALRAVMNELGTDATIVEALGEHTYTAHDPVSGTVDRTVAYFLARAPDDAQLKCTVCDGIVEARWFTKAESDTLPVYEDLRGIIAMGFEKATV
jgi:N utilization substance protein B